MGGGVRKPENMALQGCQKDTIVVQDLHGIRRAKAQLELNWESDAKNNKNGFYRCVSQKRKVKASVPSMSKTGKQVTTHKKKAEVLNNFFASVFIGNLSSHTFEVDGL